MKLYEFMMLSDDEKGEATMQGVFIGHRRLEDEVRSLYCLGDFFVELVYSADHKVFKRFRQFRKTHLLEPYLDLFEQL